MLIFLHFCGFITSLNISIKLNISSYGRAITIGRFSVLTLNFDLDLSKANWWNFMKIGLVVFEKSQRALTNEPTNRPAGSQDTVPLAAVIILQWIISSLNTFPLQCNGDLHILRPFRRDLVSVRSTNTETSCCDCSEHNVDVLPYICVSSCNCSNSTYSSTNALNTSWTRETMKSRSKMSVRNLAN